MTKKCLRCNKDFYTKPSRIKEGKGKYCSVKCYKGEKIQKSCLHCGKEFRVPPSLERVNTCSKSCGKKLSAKVGQLHPLWKEKPSYRTMHKWVERQLGKPDKCVFCETYHLSGHQIHWANISGEHKRDLSDWIRLCVKCHKDFDRKEVELPLV